MCAVRRYEEKMRAEGLRRLKDEPADAAADEPISSIEVLAWHLLHLP